MSSTALTSSSLHAQPPQEDMALVAAKRVLSTEAEALTTVASSLDYTFVGAVDLIAACSGRVIVSGMGKSGHVGTKIAATFASTGTPSFFVHPGEASHGDLGMITDQDVLILLSNSGETRELIDLINYANRFGIPLIGMTGRRDSTLARAASVALVLPSLNEACPMGLAPTTSTTVMLALGDCLAVALLEKRGFTSDDFHVFHPGGKLGAGLTRVKDIMHTSEKLPTCAPETSMSDALLIMSEHSFGIVGIVDPSGALLGVITDGDLRRHMSADLLTKTSESVMTKSPKTIAPEALIGDALHQMNTYKVNCLFVVSGANQPCGIIRVHDCLRLGAA